MQWLAENLIRDDEIVVLPPEQEDWTPASLAENWNLGDDASNSAIFAKILQARLQGGMVKLF